MTIPLNPKPSPKTCSISLLPPFLTLTGNSIYRQQWHQIGAMNGALSKQVEQISKKQELCLTLGGDHSIASGSLHGQLMNYGDDLKVVWIDAHADLNGISGSPTGNYHGMPAGHLLGNIKQGEMYGFDWMVKNMKPNNIAYIGLRDLDLFEVDFMR